MGHLDIKMCTRFQNLIANTQTRLSTSTVKEFKNRKVVRPTDKYSLFKNF